MVKIEMHCHTSPASQCAHISPEELVRAYANMGYDALVSTNHVSQYYFKSMGTYDKITERFLNDFNAVKELGEKAGLKVFFGFEANMVATNYNDYLVYGLTPDEFLALGDYVREYDLPELKRRVNGFGGLIYQAHPFRDKMEVSPPEHLDGIEVFNGHPEHDSRNHLALEYAKKHGLLQSAGSDTHSVAGAGTASMLFDHMPADEKELVQMLRLQPDFLTRK